MRKFQKHDYLLMCDWLVERDEFIPPYEFLPPTGLIISSAACGFLISCDNGFGILDFFVSNPKVPVVQRSEALDEIATSLIETAKRVGIKVLKCDTQVSSVYKLAIKHGFTSLGVYNALVRGI